MKKLLAILFCVAFAAGAADARTLYVNAKRPNNNGNGLKPSTAKKTIQAAINIARKGDTILVYPGSYQPIQTNNKKITIKSVKGRAKTKILPPAKAKYDDLAVLSKSVYPYKGTDTKLTGFLLDGRNQNYGIIGGQISSCTIQRSRQAAGNARLTSCIVSQNRYEATGWGLLGGCTLQRCKIQSNASTGGESGPGTICNCKLYNCLLTGNTCVEGSLFHVSVLINCTVVGNAITPSHYTSPFSSRSKFYNCILRNNRIGSWKEELWTWGEGYWDEHGHWIEGNPGTVVGFYDVDWNWHLGQPGAGDGYWEGETWHPYEAETRTAGYFDADGWYCEYQPEGKEVHEEVKHPAEIHNVDKGNLYSRTFQKNVNPKFANEKKGDYKLRKGSPCINQGKLASSQKKLVGTQDLAGKKRIRGKAIDMGCYEY